MKEFIRQNWFKLISLAIFLTIALSVAYYFVIYIPSKENLKLLQQQSNIEMERKIEAEQKNKEYLISRRKDCLNIYEVEGKKWNNVQSWNFNEYDDECQITYKLPIADRKTKEQCLEGYEKCEKDFPDNSFCFREQMRCIDQVFV